MNWLSANKSIMSIALLGLIAALVAIWISFYPPEAGNIASATGLSTTLKFFIALASICLWFIFLRISDTVAGIKFKESYALIESNPIALSVYFGLRSLGAGVLLGMLLG